MAVVDILNDQDEMKAHCYTFVMWPRKWREYSDVCPLDWQLCRLIDQERPKIPDEPGIYTLLIQPRIANHSMCSYLMYVGQTNSLRRRFGNYLNREKHETGRPKVFRLLNKYPDHTWFCFSPVPEAYLDSVESTLLIAYMPPANDRLPAEVSRIRRAF